MYPSDAVTRLYDIISGTSGTLGTTTATTTFLGFSVTCRANTDLHVYLGSSFAVDTENVSNMFFPVSYVVASGTPLTYTKATNDHCSIQVTSVARDRSLTSDPLSGMSSGTDFLLAFSLFLGIISLAFFSGYWLIKKFI